MIINRENIEAYLLDHLEGTLAPEMEKELQLFLMLNPEYNELVELSSDLPVVTSDDEVFDSRASLRKYSFESPDEAFVRELEGDLSETEKEELNDMLFHFPALKTDRELIAMTVLQPEHLSYPGKEDLKRRKIIALYQPALRLAAIFLLTLLSGVAISYLIKTDGKKVIAPVAETTEPATVIPDSTNFKQNVQASAPELIVNKETSAENKKRKQTPPRKESDTAKSFSNDAATIDVTLAEMNTIPASVKETELSAHVMLAAPFVTSGASTLASRQTDADKYMDVYQLTSRLLSRFSKGKIDFNHKQTEEGVLTELAVNTGSFEFVRKKSK